MGLTSTLLQSTRDAASSVALSTLQFLLRAANTRRKSPGRCSVGVSAYVSRDTMSRRNCVRAHTSSMSGGPESTGFTGPLSFSDA